MTKRRRAQLESKLAERIGSGRKQETPTSTTQEVEEVSAIDTNMDEDGLSEALETLFEEQSLNEHLVQAHQEGFHAFVVGDTVEDNPHNLDVLEEAWRDGYEDATERFLLAQVVMAARALAGSATPEETDSALDFLMEAVDSIPEFKINALESFWTQVVEAFEEGA